MKFSSAAALLSVSTAVLAQSNYTNSTSFVYVSDIETTVVTITSCGSHTCTPVPITTGVTTITKTSEQITTEYTTYCPLPSETPAPPAPAPTSVAPAPVPVPSSEAPPAPAPVPTSEAPSSLSTIPAVPTGNSTGTYFPSVSEGKGSRKMAGLSSLAALGALLFL